jgi:Ca2+-binding RTX toxin-like protein
VLVGGDGNDTLTGGAGPDVLIGGLGVDTQFGSGGEDLLIGGTTAFDLNPVALSAIAGEWFMPIAFATRQAHLTGQQSGGYNGPYLLTAATVGADDAADDLFGGDGSDWFVIKLDSAPDARPDWDAADVLTEW